MSYMIYNIQISDGRRSSAINYINKNKNNGSFKVIDIGASMGGWSIPYIDAIVDSNPCVNTNANIRFFGFDITDPEQWGELLQYVCENGKFDFCICTHTLEDIMNPGFVCSQICKIAKEGYIAFPSKYRELSRGLDNSVYNYRGYIHHRWIFTVATETQTLIAFPKINYLDSNAAFDEIANSSDSVCDLNFFWKDTIEFEYLNGNFLGPNVETVLKLYERLLDV